MSNLYGAMLCRHCINCNHSERDPEYGYTCNEDAFPNVCEKYNADVEFILSDVKAFITRNAHGAAMAEQWGCL